MFRLFVISAMIAVCAAKPGNLVLGLGQAGHGLVVGGHGLTVGGHGLTVGGHGLTVGGHGLTVGGHGLTVGGYGLTPVAIPTALSSSYRTDVINPVAAVVRQAPIAVAAPLAVASPSVAVGGLGHGLGVGLQAGSIGLGHGILGLGYGHGK